MFLLQKERAKALKSAPKPSTSPVEPPMPKPGEPGAETTGGEELVTVRSFGVLEAT